jgi:DNA-binding transcriptional MerR regulator
MTISEVGDKYGFSADTLRYYEKIGLLTSHRRESGIRYYEEDDLQRLAFIKCMRAAGVSIETLQEYLALFKKGDSTYEERKQLLVRERSRLLEKRKQLDETIDHLNWKIEHYDEICHAKKGEKQ